MKQNGAGKIKSEILWECYKEEYSKRVKWDEVYVIGQMWEQVVDIMRSVWLCKGGKKEPKEWVEVRGCMDECVEGN